MNWLVCDAMTIADWRFIICLSHLASSFHIFSSDLPVLIIYGIFSALLASWMLARTLSSMINYQVASRAWSSHARSIELDNHASVVTKMSRRVKAIAISTSWFLLAEFQYNGTMFVKFVNNSDITWDPLFSGKIDCPFDGVVSQLLSKRLSDSVHINFSNLH